MIIEIADFSVEESKRADFELAIANGVKTVLSKAKGYQGHKIMSSQENKERVVLMVNWATLEDHTVGFRQSPDFTNWRAIIGPFFKSPPVVEHFVVSDQTS